MRQNLAEILQQLLFHVPVPVRETQQHILQQLGSLLLGKTKYPAANPFNAVQSGRDMRTGDYSSRIALNLCLSSLYESSYTCCMVLKLGYHMLMLWRFFTVLLLLVGACL